MKRISLIIVFIFTLLSVFSQHEGKYVHIKETGGKLHQILHSKIDSICFSHYNINGSQSDFWETQIVYAKDRAFAFPLSSIGDIKFNMPYVQPTSSQYTIIPVDDISEWDSLMVTTDGVYSVLKKDENNEYVLVIDDVNKEIVPYPITAFFDINEQPVKVFLDDYIIYISYDNSIPSEITICKDDERFVYNDVKTLSALQFNRRAGVNQNNYFGFLNNLTSVVQICSSLGSTFQNFLDSFVSTLGYMTGKGLEDCRIVELSNSILFTSFGFIITGTGVTLGLGTVTAGTLVLGLVSAGTAILKYHEDIENEYKQIWYFGEAGLAKIETLLPVSLQNNTYQLRARVSNTSTLPYSEKKNTFGILLEKENDGVEAVNLYSKGTQICLERELTEDGVFDVNVHNIEPGYKYFCRAFISTASEKELRDKGKMNHWKSYAYYGDIQEFMLDGPKRKLNYKQVSAENKDEDKVHFKMDVEVDIIDFSEDIEKYGVRLYKNDVKYDLGSEIEILYLRSGLPSTNPVWNEGYRKVEIEFDADKDALTLDKDLLQASTKDHWRIETYVQYGRGNNVRESKSSQPLDLVFNEKPKAKTLDMTTATQATSAIVECEYLHYGLWGGKCGVEYWKGDGEHLEKYTNNFQDKGPSIELSDLDPFTEYKYRAFIKVNDTYFYAQEIKDFVTQACKPKLVDYEILEATFDQNNYHHDGETYSYRFHIATQWKIESLKNLVDWGYKYIDLNNKTGKISLMNFGSSYKDSRFAFYRNSKDSEILVLPYAQYGNGSANVNSSKRRVSEEEEENIIYGDTVRIRLLYDKQPEQLQLCPDDNHPHKIDLGLPSGTKWSCCNYGATKPEEHGLYLAWGEHQEKEYYKYMTYSFWIDSNMNDRWDEGEFEYIGNDISGTQYDPSHVGWGSNWHMPSSERVQELIDYCTSSPYTYKGMFGVLITGSNGNSIFMPASGYRINYDLLYYNERGIYWTSTLSESGEGGDAIPFSFSTNKPKVGTGSDRHNGRSIRPIY